MAEVVERREFPRMIAEYPLRYRVIPESPPPGFHGALARDISAGGVRFRTFDYLALGARVLIELQLPSGLPIRAVGTTAWVRTLPNDDGYEVGSRFEEAGSQLYAAFEGRGSAAVAGSLALD